MNETHPFGSFVPSDSRYLILGSFPARTKDNFYKWFYGSNRNQFWQIMENVYDLKLSDQNTKEDLFTKHKIALADVIHKTQRVNNSNLDINLINRTYNLTGVSEILKNNKIKKIFFTSRHVENIFHRHFKSLVQKYPGIALITLPSPSPRYASLTIGNKIKIYKKHLPKYRSY